MAQITNTFVPYGGISAAVAFTAATGSDYFIPGNSDSRVGIIIKNSNAQNAAVTLQAGDGTLSPLGNITVTVGANQTVYVPFDRVSSSRVKVTTGTGKGMVNISTAVNTGGTVANVGFGVISVE